MKKTSKTTRDVIYKYGGFNGGYPNSWMIFVMEDPKMDDWGYPFVDLEPCLITGG